MKLKNTLKVTFLIKNGLSCPEIKEKSSDYFVQTLKKYICKVR